VVFVWLGSRSFAALQAAAFYLSFIWVSGLLLPFVQNSPRLSLSWRERLRLALNYLHRNFYQQMLFFVLPLYWASATLASRQAVWLLLVLLLAILATLDVVYDRILSRQWLAMAVYFSLTLFAVVNVMIPVLIHLSTLVALIVAAGLAWGGFASFCILHSPLPQVKKRSALAGAAVVLLGLVGFGRSLIPPAPLQLVSATFAQSIQPATLRVDRPLRVVGATRHWVVVTAIRAPLGLADRIRHRWFAGEREFYVSPLFWVAGGRREGYRLWTQAGLSPRVLQGKNIRVRVETGSGQLIGEVELPYAAPRGGTS
jgi:hypothetical protein